MENGRRCCLALEMARKYFVQGDHEERRPNFIQHVARLSGVDFELVLKDLMTAGGRARQPFKQTLLRRIKHEMQGRPRLAVARHGICDEKRLECCC